MRGEIKLLLHSFFTVTGTFIKDYKGDADRGWGEVIWLFVIGDKIKQENDMCMIWM